MSPPHHLHGDQLHEHYHRADENNDHDHSPVAHRPASLVSPTKKVANSEKAAEPAVQPAPATAEAGPSTPASVDPFTMALLRGASPEPRRESPPSTFDHGTAAPLAQPKQPPAESSSSNLFGDSMGSDSLFGPPLEHEGIAAFTETAVPASSGSRFAKLFETLHAADEPHSKQSAPFPPQQQLPTATHPQPAFPGSGAFPSSGPFAAAAAPSPFAPAVSSPQPSTTSLFGGGLSSSAAPPSSLFGSSRLPQQQQAPKTSLPATGGPAQTATASQAQLQQALLQQLRAAPPATTAKVQQILERASSNASTQGGGVPALLHQLQAQAQQKREQAEQQARAMAAAATQQQQQQAAALAKLQQMQAQQQQMKKLLQEQQQHARQQGGYEGGTPPPSTSTMAALNRLLSASSHQSSQAAGGGGAGSSAAAVAAPVGTPSPGIDVNALFWTYLDPHGRKQGPFSNAQMKTWHSANYFAADLPLAFSTSSAPTPGSRFAPLNRIFPPGSKPFSDAPRPVGTAAAPPRPSSSSSSLGSTPSPTRSGMIAAALEKQASNASLSSSGGHSRSPPPPPVLPPTQPPNARRGNHEAAGSAGRSRGGKANRQQPPVLPPTAPPTNSRSASPEGRRFDERGRAKEQASESLRGLLGLNSASRSPSNSSSPERITPSAHAKPSGGERSTETDQQRKQGGRGGRRSNPDGSDRPRTVYPRRPGDEKDKPKTVVAGKDVADPSSLHKGWLWSPSDEAAMRRKELGREVAPSPAPKKMSLKEIMACENDANNIKALMTGHNATQPHKMKIPAAKKKSQKQLKKEAAEASKNSGSS
ncbi:hypothetical protein FOL47_001417 [Perkinsus chesapeaki]|uniref:GYF domain-containing protein n=1 Tax=Perkinsus chesapeaki TaxID=330153 RepID=A0A7J6MIZ9_PERCH|nr:hypothetical protein FOL47_001417 [Perkinsus chesapeaki]